MRPFLSKLVSVILLVGIFSVTILAEKSTEEARLIRKAFLDIKRVPPTPDELNWYLCYNSKPYETAINWLVSNTKNLNLKEYLLSEEYKISSPYKLDDEMQNLIIKYQCGNLNLSNKEADKALIKLSILCGEGSTIDTIDYMASCLMARPTTTKEINVLLKLFKEQNTEEAGYLAVLNVLKTYKDFVFN